MMPTDDPADLFMLLYDQLGEAPFNGDAPAAQWNEDPVIVDYAEDVRDGVLASGKAAADLVEPILALGDRGTFAVLKGLDMALERANPFSGTYSSPAMLYKLVSRWAYEGRLDTGEFGGALLAGCSFPGRPLGAPVRAEFFSVRRVPAASWDALKLQHVENAEDIPFEPRHSKAPPKVDIGCVPMLGTYQEVTFAADGQAPNRRYRIAPKAAPLRDRVERVLRALDDSGAVIGLMPEASLSDELLRAWQDTIHGLPTPPESRLEWILVGTGPIGDADPPPNRAVLLHRETGRVLLEHDKWFGFTLSPKQLVDWKLVKQLGADRAIEDITPGSPPLRLLESNFGRVAVLICEDLTRLIDFGPALRDSGVSHVFVPIFSGPTCWAKGAAAPYVCDIGSWLIIANSLAVARAQGTKGPVETCSSIGPHDGSRDEWHLEAEAKAASRPDEVCLVTVSSGIAHRFPDFS